MNHQQHRPASTAMPRCALCGAPGFTEELVMHTELNHVYFRCKKHDSNPAFRLNPLFKPSEPHVNGSLRWSDSSSMPEERRLTQELERANQFIAQLQDALRQFTTAINSSAPDRPVSELRDQLLPPGNVGMDIFRLLDTNGKR